MLDISQKTYMKTFTVCQNSITNPTLTYLLTFIHIQIELSRRWDFTGSRHIAFTILTLCKMNNLAETI